MQTSANWHEYHADITISQLVVQEAAHATPGCYPMTLSCAWLGGDILLEIVRSEDDRIFGIYYMSEVTAELWASNLGFKFIEKGWQVIESTRAERPYIAGIVFPRESPNLLGSAIQDSIEWLNPEQVLTGNLAIPDYVCPID